MNILIDIAHPAHVHLIRRTYVELIKKGHTIYVTVKEIPSAIALLEKFNIPYIQMGKRKDSIHAKAFFQIIYNLKVWWLVIRKNIKIGFGSSLTIAQISRISALKAIVLDDDDDSIEPLFG
jgi:predicted glycosyltransferase